MLRTFAYSWAQSSDMKAIFIITFGFLQASLVAQLVKNLPAMEETLVRFQGQEDTLEKG